MKEFKDTIQKYLEQRVAEDPLFAPKFENPKKNIDECCRYILGEARKRGTSVVMSDAEVFGMAVHYYDEENIKIEKVSAGCSISSNQKVELTEKDKSEYSLARWQIDAHASWKSSGNSLLSYEDMKGAGIDKIRHLFRNYEREHIYNYEEHVSFAEELEAYGKLPRTFMAVDPVSKKDWIWDDVVRMRTLNTKQSQKKRQNHICPLQLDIVERLIERYSNKGELVFDPFGGIGTVPYCAVKLGRRGLSTELNYDYWKDSLTYLREIEMEVEAPTLFDLMGIPERMTV